jgi:hypothetical protein
LKRKIYVAKIYVNKKGNKYVYIPNEFPTERALVKVLPDHVEIHPIDYKKYYPAEDIIDAYAEFNPTR